MSIDISLDFIHSVQLITPLSFSFDKPHDVICPAKATVSNSPHYRL
jgi:hypothetical protein